MGHAAASRVQGGFTLVEVIVALGITTLAIGMVGGGLFHTLSVDAAWRAGLGATLNWRNATNYLRLDAINAQATTVPDGAAPTAAASFSWTGQDGTPHTAAYALAGTTLQRTFDGVTQPVARRVSGTTYARTGRMLTATVSVTGATGAADTVTSNIFLRGLP